MKHFSILFACLATLIFYSCNDAESNKDFKFFLVNLSTKDTVFQTDFNRGEEIYFNCPKSIKQTILVASVHWELGQISVVVPVLAGKVNKYLMNKEGINEKGVAQSMDKHLFSFSGNPYLRDYEQFLEGISAHGKDTSKLANGLVENLTVFSNKYPESELVGYHIYSVVSNSVGVGFERFLTEKNKHNWNTLRKKTDDTFTKELNRMLAAGEVANCIQSGENKLVFQSKNSKIHPDVLKGNLKVIIFWATWCGPCKPQMKILADLNQKKYLEKPVVFFGVTSEPDHKVVFSWWEKNQAKYEGLSLFHDEQFCMSSNYKITQYPTILVFDKNDKLVKRDVGMNEVEQMIDSLLKQ